MFDDILAEGEKHNKVIFNWGCWKTIVKDTTWVVKLVNKLILDIIIFLAVPFYPIITSRYIKKKYKLIVYTKYKKYNKYKYRSIQIYKYPKINNQPPIPPTCTP